jgi:hypothetical protein
MKFVRLMPVLATLPVLMLGAPAEAQTSPKLTINKESGTAPVVVSLAPASTVQVDAAGDITVVCSGTCSNLGSGGGETGANPPTASLTAGAASIEVGQSLGLSWNSTGDACYSSGPSNAAGWTGVTRNSTGNFNVTGLAQGAYTFQIRCYSAGGSVTVSSAQVSVVPSTTPPASNYCAEFYDGTPPMPTGSNFNAHGFQKVEKDFAQVFGIAPGDSFSDIRPLPGPHLNPIQTRYLAIPFVMTEDTGNLSSMQIQWIDGSPDGTPGGAILMTISPCPGDFRPMQGITNSADVYLGSNCRLLGPESLSGGLTISSEAGTSSCPAPKNKQMYINVATYNMYGVSAPSNTTCGSGVTMCGVGVTVR